MAECATWRVGIIDNESKALVPAGGSLQLSGDLVGPVARMWTGIAWPFKGVAGQADFGEGGAFHVASFLGVVGTAIARPAAR